MRHECSLHVIRKFGGLTKGIVLVCSGRRDEDDKLVASAADDKLVASAAEIHGLPVGGVESKPRGGRRAPSEAVKNGASPSPASHGRCEFGGSRSRSCTTTPLRLNDPS